MKRLPRCPELAEQTRGRERGQAFTAVEPWRRNEPGSKSPAKAEERVVDEWAKWVSQKMATGCPATLRKRIVASSSISPARPWSPQKLLLGLSHDRRLVLRRKTICEERRGNHDSRNSLLPCQSVRGSIRLLHDIANVAIDDPQKPLQT